MKKVSSKNLAEAIYESTLDKKGVDLANAISNFVKMLASKRMMHKSNEVLNALESLLDQKSETIRAKIYTAKKMQDTDKKDIENKLKEKYKAKNIISQFFENKELLGGMRVEVGDEVLDSTWRTGLKKLEKVLIK